MGKLRDSLRVQFIQVKPCEIISTGPNSG